MDLDLYLGGIFTIWYLNYQYFSKEKVKHMGEQWRWSFSCLSISSKSVVGFFCLPLLPSSRDQYIGSPPW